MNERVDAVDRRVFERDGHTCLHCGAHPTEPAALETYPIGGVDGSNSLATVCRDCYGLLSGEAPAWLRDGGSDPAALFAFLEAVTSTQGSTVADVAEFATEATAGPDGTDPAARRQYGANRRRVRLALAVIDRHLDVMTGLLESSDPGASASRTDGSTPSAETDLGELEPPTDAACETVHDLARRLQDQLAETVTLAETAVVAEGVCHACLDQLDGRQCQSCATTARSTEPWRTADGGVAVADLYRTITDRLQAAAETTAQLTEAAADLAERLVD